QAIKNGVEQGHGTQSNRSGIKDLWPSASRFWHLIKPGSETVNNPDPESFRPQNQRSRTQNPKQTRPQPPVERCWAERADSRPPLRGPGGWGGGDWYVWHAPDGPSAIAATALGCVQASAEKLGVIGASYASAIIGVLSLVSSHCVSSVAEKSSSPFPCGGPFSVPLRRPLAFRSNFQLGPMLYDRNNDAAVPCERQEGRLGNWQATNSHRIVNGQPFGIGGKKGRLLLAPSLGPSCSRR